MATKNCKEYFVPQIVEYVNTQKENCQKIEGNPVLEQQTQFLEGMANMICSFIFAECAKNQALDNALALEYKNVERCIKFVLDKAEKFSGRNKKNPWANPVRMLWIPDATVYSWITEYYMLDDKEEYEKEKLEEEERRIKAEEEAKKRAERNAKKTENDIKKAVKEIVTKETVSGFLSNVNPSAELLRQIGAEAYIGVNIINVDNVEARAEVEKLALKAINDKEIKLTLTGFCGKYKLSKDRVAQIEAEVREKYAAKAEETPEEVDEEEPYDEEETYDEEEPLNEDTTLNEEEPLDDLHFADDLRFAS